MTSEKDFIQKVKEIREKIHFESGTPQKNKALLQYLKEYCASTLADSKPNASFEKKIKDVLFETENDMEKILTVQPMEPLKKIPTISNRPQGTSVGGYAPEPLRNALSSVEVAPFNPLESPILRNLNKKVSPTSKIINKTLENSKNSEENISSQPFPKVTPFPGSNIQIKENSKKFQGATLKIDQLKLEIDLNFSDSIELIGKQTFTSIKFKVDIPDGFFDPIQKIDKRCKPSEHCIIEQNKYGDFILKDRFDLEKTYYNGKFIDKKGELLNDGDSFILPVNINDQLSSLSIIFHKKE